MAMMDLRGVGFWTVIKRTLKGFSEDDMSTYAAALAYRALFALFPFTLFLIALLGFLNVPEFFDWLREQASIALPPAAMEEVNPVIDQLQEERGGLVSAGILIALWTASVGVRALMNAMNNAYDVEEGRPVWKLTILSIIYTVGIALMLLAAAGIMITGSQVMEWLAGVVGFEDSVLTLWAVLRWPLAALLLTTVIALLYYFAPDVEQEFRFITPGSVVAVIVWIVASIGFGIYVQNFGNYDAIYGSIGTIIILMLYFYISSAVLLLGAEMNAVIEHASVEGKEQGDKEVNG